MYQSSGALMHHFEHLSPVKRAELLTEGTGADRWSAAADDRLIGDLWAELSDGRCRFMMVKDKQWEQIETFLQ